MAQRERRIRIIEVGGEPFGLEQHTLGHVAAPVLHRGAKYPKVHAALRQMRGYREAIWSRSDDDSVYIHDSCSAPAWSVGGYIIYGLPYLQAIARFVHGRCTLLNDIS